MAIQILAIVIVGLLVTLILANVAENISLKNIGRRVKENLVEDFFELFSGLLGILLVIGVILLIAAAFGAFNK